jgi:hypothetical protein
VDAPAPPQRGRLLRRKFQAIAAGKVRTVWDYQFMVQRARADQLTVVPGRNLILNIGFDGTGTHFGKGGRPWAAPAFAYDPADDWSGLTAGSSPTNVTTAIT